MECRDPYQETQEACYCAAGWNNWKCDNELPRKCKTDILKPDMAAGCPGAVDSDDYVYSIKGYDPCHELDFTRPYELEYNVTCRDVDNEGRVIAGGHQEGLGYGYLDLVSVDTTNIKPFDYKFVSNKTGLRMMDNPDMDFVFDFRDFKYLSKVKRHKQKITDPKIMGGDVNGKIEIDLKYLLDQDSSGYPAKAHYVVAGRAFWEANVIRPNISRFVTSGFFAQEGYVEPKLADLKKNWTVEIVLSCVAIILFIVLVVHCVKKERQKRKEYEAER